VRAVLDPNILIAALLSRSGAPGQIVARWLAGDFELVVSEWLLAELGRALAYPKLRARICPEEADEFVSLLAHAAILAPDSSTPAGRSADPDDDYLIALAGTTQSLLVSGDRHLLELADELPIQTARAFLDVLERGSARP
jgi:putative PIN family toxin of toxin-antitoxin system